MGKILSKKVLISIVSASIFFLSAYYMGTHVFASEFANNEENYELGVLPPPKTGSLEFEEYSSHYAENSDKYPKLYSNITLPTSCDLSISPYFPQIGSQKGNCCTSWSTTYYQFTYESNKLNMI